MSFINGGADSPRAVMRRAWNWLIQGPAAAAPPPPPVGVFNLFFGENNTIPFTVTGPPVTEQARFFLDLTDIDVFNFESEVPDLYPLGLTYAFTGAQTGVTVTVTGSNVDGRPFAVLDVPEAGRYNTTSGGAQYGRFYDDVTFEFNTPVNAFGIYGTDWGDFNGNVIADITDENNVVTSFVVPNAVPAINGNLIFWGFSSAPVKYKKVKFTCIYIIPPPVGARDFFGIDDLYIGNLVI